MPRKKKPPKVEYYRLDRILKEKAVYNMIIGERSNGKSFSVLEYGLKKFLATGETMAYIRRWDEDIRGKRGASICAAIAHELDIYEMTEGEFDSITYWNTRWYLSTHDERGKAIKAETPFMYGFSLSTMEHDKSASFPDVTTILFDEFLTRSGYLPDEFVLFMNTLSTIIRHRDNVEIFMLGNTVNKSCPYFTEMGLTHVPNMKQGSIELYSYGESDLKVAVEYCASAAKGGGKPSDKYFAFNNPKLQMITTGTWEFSLYPHAPCKIRPKDVRYSFYVEFEESLLQLDVCVTDIGSFIYVHRKTTPVKDMKTDICFSPILHGEGGSYRKLTRAAHISKGFQKIVDMLRMERVFFQDNEVGEVFRNYLQWCARSDDFTM